MVGVVGRDEEMLRMAFSRRSRDSMARLGLQCRAARTELLEVGL